MTAHNVDNVISFLDSNKVSFQQNQYQRQLTKLIFALSVTVLEAILY